MLCSGGVHLSPQFDCLLVGSVSVVVREEPLHGNISPVKGRVSLLFTMDVHRLDRSVLEFLPEVFDCFRGIL